MHGSKEERHEHWRRINADWERSGLSQSKYCLGHGIKLKHFETWRYRLRKEKSAGGLPQVVALDRELSLPSVFSCSPKHPCSGIRICRGAFQMELINISTVASWRTVSPERAARTAGMTFSWPFPARPGFSALPARRSGR